MAQSSVKTVNIEKMECAHAKHLLEISVLNFSHALATAQCSYTRPLPRQDLHLPIAEANNSAPGALSLSECLEIYKPRAQ